MCVSVCVSTHVHTHMCVHMCILLILFFWKILLNMPTNLDLLLDQDKDRGTEGPSGLSRRGCSF